MFADMLNHAQFGDDRMVRRYPSRRPALEILRADDPSRMLVGFVGLTQDRGGQELRRVWRMRVRDLHRWPEHRLAGLFLHVWRDALANPGRREQLRALFADLSDPDRLKLLDRYANAVVPDPEFIPYSLPAIDDPDFALLRR